MQRSPPLLEKNCNAKLAEDLSKPINFCWAWAKNSKSPAKTSSTRKKNKSLIFDSCIQGNKSTNKTYQVQRCGTHPKYLLQCQRHPKMWIWVQASMAGESHAKLLSCQMWLSRSLVMSSLMFPYNVYRLRILHEINWYDRFISSKLQHHMIKGCLGDPWIFTRFIVRCTSLLLTTS